MRTCNPDVTNRKAKIAPPKDHPSVYVGESARSAKERTKEHWRRYRQKREDSHILKHHLLHHQGEGELSFQMRVAGVYRSALTRQIAEAAKIRRWGEGILLNSKSELNRCQLGRLTLGEESSSTTSSSKDRRVQEDILEEDGAEVDKEVKIWKMKKTHMEIGVLNLHS